MSLLFDQITIQLVRQTCGECGIVFGMEQEYHDKLVRENGGFHCPNGHARRFIGETEVDKLKKQLASKEDWLKWERERTDRLSTQLQQQKYQTRAARAAKTRMKNRIKNGVCPCCNRTFKNLADHFKLKHPEELDKHPEIAAIHLKITAKKM